MEKLSEIEQKIASTPTRKKKRVLPQLRGRIELKAIVRSGKQRLALNLAPELLSLTGSLATNIAQGVIPENQCDSESCIYMHYYYAKNKSEQFTDFLIENPLIILPTWQVLTDNNLSVTLKIEQLWELGWTARSITRQGLRRMYVLSHLLDPNSVAFFPLSPIIKQHRRKKSKPKLKAKVTLFYNS